VQEAEQRRVGQAKGDMSVLAGAQVRDRVQVGRVGGVDGSGFALT